MQSGIFDVAVLFSKPIILTNMLSWIFPFPPRKGDLGILKNLFCKKRNRVLSLNERFQLGWNVNGHMNKDENYKYIELRKIKISL